MKTHHGMRFVMKILTFGIAQIYLAFQLLNRIFAENLAALGKLKASSLCSRWQNLCRKFSGWAPSSMDRKSFS